MITNTTYACFVAIGAELAYLMPNHVFHVTFLKKEYNLEMIVFASLATMIQIHAKLVLGHVLHALAILKTHV